MSENKPVSVLNELYQRLGRAPGIRQLLGGGSLLTRSD